MSKEVFDEYLQAGVREAGGIGFTKTGPVNIVLQNRREELGLKQGDLAREIGVSTARISQLESLKGIPSPELAEKIARVLGTREEEVFPPYLEAFIRPRSGSNKSSVEIIPLFMVKTAELELAFQQDQPNSWVVDPAEFCNRRERTEALKRALDTLTGRERDVILYRFAEGLTQRETGKIYEVTGERIRQIEAKALRKLRHPSRSNGLRWFTDQVDRKRKDVSVETLFNGAINALHQQNRGRTLRNIEQIEEFILRRIGEVNQGLVEVVYQCLDSCGWSKQGVEQFLEVYQKELEKVRIPRIDELDEFNPEVVSRLIGELRPVWLLKKQAESLPPKDYRSELKG